MKLKKIEKVEVEIARLIDAIQQMRERSGDPKEFAWETFPRETGAVRRASMDLTRALANLRRHDD